MAHDDALVELLRGPKAKFHLCDLHVHSPASKDYDATALGDFGLHTLPTEPKKREEQLLGLLPPERFLEGVAERRDSIARREGMRKGEDWAVVAVTDHNVCEYSTRLASYAWDARSKHRLVVLPGLELDVVFPMGPDRTETDIHVLCCFAPKTGSSDIRLALTSASNVPTWSFGAPLHVDGLPRFIQNLRQHSGYPAMCIAAHVGSSRGVREAGKKTLLDNLDAEIARLEGELEQAAPEDQKDIQADLESLVRRKTDDTVSRAVLKLVGECGFDALQVRDKRDEKHYRRLHRFSETLGRAVPIICSDAHNTANIFSCGDHTPYIKLPAIYQGGTPQEVFNAIRERSIRYGETRFASAGPNRVEEWIAGLRIRPDTDDAGSFWTMLGNASTDGNESATQERGLVLPLSRNLNCLIGGRGSGKSAALEALAFIAQPSDFDRGRRKTDSKRSNWYGRAQKTLSKCVIEVIWRLPPQRDMNSSQSGAVVVSRYFDEGGSHGQCLYHSLDGSQLTRDSTPDLKVALFRMGDIEELAKSTDRVRELLDSFCDEEMAHIKSRVKRALGELQTQNYRLAGIARKVAELTKDGAPLRDYVNRTRQYMTVNHPSVQAKYKQVDQARTASRKAEALRAEWDNLCEEYQPTELRSKLLELFTDALENALDENGQPLPFCNGLAGLCHGFDDQDADDQYLARRMLNTVETMADEFAQFGKQLAVVEDSVQEQLEGFQRELAAEGMPVGSGIREAKKRSFDEARGDLRKYKELLAKYFRMRSGREQLFADLTTLCQKRTELRKQTAAGLANRLAADLDPDILVIEVDAQPMADRTQFAAWLDRNLRQSVKNNREQRIQALLDNDLMPGELSDVLLLGRGDHSLLVTNRPSAAEGDISDSLAKKIVDSCTAMKRIEPEAYGDDIPENVESVIPQEIREGLWTFPESGSSAILENVLRLHELVFDDLPVIRLNDRPTEDGSCPRPLEELSPGQQCSAVLPIVLLTGSCPLLIDQPEDNLDNRLIRQVVVNILAHTKLRRQVILATHNPNLPVLGDVEQAVILRATGESECVLEALGDMDDPTVVRHVTDVMEGGREAFQYRETIYRPHWQGTIAEE